MHLYQTNTKKLLLKEIKCFKIVSGDIACVTLSKDGEFVATGHVASKGKAAIIFWDYGERTAKATIMHHIGWVHHKNFSQSIIAEHFSVNKFISHSVLKAICIKGILKLTEIH